MKQTSIDKLNEHLFETIEMLKNNSDPNADAHEKMDIETAKLICDAGKVIIDGYKVKVMAMNVLAKADNPQSVIAQIANAGILNEGSTNQLKQ